MVSGCRRFSGPPLQIPIAHSWFSNSGCAIAHQSPIRIKARRIELLTCYVCPWPALPAPENRMFPATSMDTDRGMRPHNFMASLRAFQPLMARGAGTTSLQTGGMVVTRNQLDGFANPKAALPPPSHDRQLLVMQKHAYRIRNAVTHDVIAGPRELVCNRLDRNDRKALGPLALVEASDRSVVSNRAMRGLDEGPA